MKLRDFRWGGFHEICGQFGLLVRLCLQVGRTWKWKSTGFLGICVWRSRGLRGLWLSSKFWHGTWLPGDFQIRWNDVRLGMVASPWCRKDVLSINGLPVLPIYCFLHWLQVSIYTTLLTRQLMFSGPQKVRPVTVHVIWFVVFNSLHHVQFGFGHLFRQSFRSFTVWIGFKRLHRTSVSLRFRFLRYARIGASGYISLHSGDRCKTGQCFLMIFNKFGLSGLYVRTSGILFVPSAFVFVPWIISWWSWLRTFLYDSSMISSLRLRLRHDSFNVK